MPDTPDLNPARAHHDMGGVSTYLCQPVDTQPHALSAYDRRVDALRQVLAAKGLLTVDELRRGIETLPAGDYDRLTYYQRWLRSILSVLVHRGVLSPAEARTCLPDLTLPA